MADTPLGRTALVLAARLDSPEGESGAGLAAVARQLTAILATVAATAPRSQDDPLARIRARRDAKRAAPLPDPEDRPA